MADVVNLRQARKRMRRSEAEAQAANNRVTHGRSKPDVASAKAETAERDRLLDGAYRSSPPLSDDPQSR
ncbi:DUF4169 family protein [Aureimonas sp. AU12]|uniref:DUF4169 family protein n=1 Tax=Aureimonas sp. AU12 TaxID=1638161 RepID=UPI0009E6D19C|nr:DUF4169 family protein [Aureimonas sp. AU12]